MDVQVAEAINQFLSNVVWPILGALLLTGVNWVVLKIAKKYGLQVSAEQQKALEAYTLQAIAFTEEYAAGRIKRAEPKLTSNEKLNLAATQILNAFPQIDDKQARILVEGMIGRVAGAGATGASSVSKPPIIPEPDGLP